MKHCSRGKHDLPESEFSRRADGRLQSWCRKCNAADCAQRRKNVTAPPPKIPADPLNLALRKMPGNRGPLLGIADALAIAA